MICGYNGCEAVAQQTHCEGRGATAMRDIPNDDMPGFGTEWPEHCSACCRLISSGTIPAWPLRSDG